MTGLEVFIHHIYEYEKGLRNLVLYTDYLLNLPRIEAKLIKRKISYEVYTLPSGKINVFYGSKNAVNVVRQIGKQLLTNYTPEEDFILGIMLGYDRDKQCKRYLSIKERAEQAAG